MFRGESYSGCECDPEVLSMWHNHPCCVKCLNSTAEGGVTRNDCFGESVGATLAETVKEKGVFKRPLVLHSPGTELCREQCSDVRGIVCGNRANHIQSHPLPHPEGSMV